MTREATIYLDYAAATPCSPAVVEAMLPYLTNSFYNPSSPYAPAVEVRRDVEAARHRIASTIGARSADIIFTAGATESINLALTAAGDGHMITSTIEHPAVLSTALQYETTVVEVDPRGLVSPDDIERAIRPQTRLVSIGLANNEVGTIQSISKISQVIKAERDRRREAGESAPIWLHSDASQGVGQIDISPSRLGVDMLTLNAAKCYGPKQMGLLWRAPDVDIRPIIHGGGQESALRSGTENIAGIVGFAEALSRAESGRKTESKRLAALRDKLQRQILMALPDASVSGHPSRRLPGHLHLVFDGVDAERLVFMLESEGIFVATGSACAANSGTRSHVLTAVGLTDTQADGSLRISMGMATTDSDVDRAAQAIVDAVLTEKRRVKA